MSGAEGDGVYNSPLISVIDKALITHAGVSDKTLTFSVPADYTAASFQLYGRSSGEVLWDSSTGSVFFVSAVKGLEVTAVFQNNYKAEDGRHYSTLAPIPLTTGYFYVAPRASYTPDYYLQGDFSTKSLTIANCGRSDGYNAFMTTSLAQNDYLYYDPIRTAILAPANGKINAPIVAGSLVVSGYPGLTVTGKRVEIFVQPGPANAQATWLRSAASSECPSRSAGTDAILGTLDLPVVARTRAGCGSSFRISEPRMKVNGPSPSATAGPDHLASTGIVTAARETQLRAGTAPGLSS
jgi:hypothetical protein